MGGGLVGYLVARLTEEPGDYLSGATSFDFVIGALLGAILVPLSAAVWSRLARSQRADGTHSR